MTEVSHHDAVWSSPCLLGQRDAVIHLPEPAPGNLALLHSLSRIFGIHLRTAGQQPDHPLLGALARLFHKVTVAPDTGLERQLRPWANVYLIQHGVLRLFRETPTSKVSIHHFFTEGDLAWPVFGRTRTGRNSLCLATVTHATLWVADFQAFRTVIRQHGDGHWARFALALIEELAEQATLREFQRQTLAAAERYQLLQQDYPELVKRVPDNQLASWLGVAPATYSRLKNGC